MAAVAIVGAGIAGLAAAGELEARGARPTLFDRGRRPGGRCATRGSGERAFDHGAQHFSAREPAFRKQVAALEGAQVLARWTGAVVECDARTGAVRPRAARVPRYVGTPDMAALPRALTAGLTVHAATRVTRLRQNACGWALFDADGNPLGDYDAVLLALPPEQARPLIPSRSRLAPFVDARRSLACWALMATFEIPLGSNFDAAHVHGGALAWAARDSAKPGRASGERWVVHATPAWSAARLDMPAESAADALLEALFKELHLPPRLPVTLDAHRWALAAPANPARCGSLWDAELSLGVCGDWCVAPRIEGAWLSGIHAARQLLGVATSAK